MCSGHCSCPLASCSSSLTQINNSDNLYVICKYSTDLYLNSCQKHIRKLTCLTHCINGIGLQSKRILGKYLHFFSQIESLTQRLKPQNYRYAALGATFIWSELTHQVVLLTGSPRNKQSNPTV